MLQALEILIGGAVFCSVAFFFIKTMIETAKREGELAERLAHQYAENAALKRSQTELNKPTTVEDTTSSLDKGTF